MNLNLIPCEPLSTRLLYQTYSTCASIKKTGVRKLVYYPSIICGITLSLLIGVVEYVAEKALQQLRKPFLSEGRFDHKEWKSQCRTWQLEAAIQTIGEFAYDEINPTLFPTYGPLLREMHYYLSIRSSNQWIYMDENAPLIRNMGEQIKLKMNRGMHRIVRLYTKDISNGIDDTDRHSEIFLKQICAHYDSMRKDLGFAMNKKCFYG